MPGASLSGTLHGISIFIFFHIFRPFLAVVSAIFIVCLIAQKGQKSAALEENKCRLKD
jgi:hypothetical protein